VALGNAEEEGSPVVAAPVLRLDLGADAEGEDGTWAGGAEGLVGAGDLGRGEAEVPTEGIVEAGVAERGEGASEAGGLGLELLGGGFEAVLLEVVGEGDAKVAGDAAEAEEEGVAAGDLEAAGGGKVDEDIGTPAADLKGEGEEGAGAAGADRVAQVAVDEVGVAEDGFGGRSLGVDGEVVEEAALGGGKGAGDEVEGGQGDERVSEATEAVDEDALRWGFQGGNSLGQAGAESNGNLAGISRSGSNWSGVAAGAPAVGRRGNRRIDFGFGESADTVLSAPLHVDTSYA
jgi:hypothetical protein